MLISSLHYGPISIREIRIFRQRITQLPNSPPNSVQSRSTVLPRLLYNSLHSDGGRYACRSFGTLMGCRCVELAAQNRSWRGSNSPPLRGTEKRRRAESTLGCSEDGRR